MAKRDQRPKRFPLTKSELQCLNRFGCSYRSRNGSFFIDWRGKSVDAASKARILATLTYLDSEAGPLVCLVLEISPTRPVPQYFYFPFDLSKPNHRDCLAKLVETGELSLLFVTETKTLKREHRFSPAVLSRAKHLYSRASERFEEHKAAGYDFQLALVHLERWLRVPDCFSYLLSDEDFAEIQSRVTDAAALIPNEQRERVHNIIARARKQFEPFYLKNEDQLIENLHLLRRGLVFIFDMRRMSANGQSEILDFVADGIASTLTQAEIENLDRWVRALSLLPAISSTFRSESGVTALRSVMLPLLPKEIVGIVELVAARGGISPGSLKNLAELFGMTVESKPGRPQKDYSREYEHKISGATWTEVARRAVAERADLRKEFQGIDYESLDYVHRDQIWNRVRQGVRSWARHAGKPLPSDVEAPPLGEENP